MHAARLITVVGFLLVVGCSKGGREAKAPAPESGSQATGSQATGSGETGTQATGTQETAVASTDAPSAQSFDTPEAVFAEFSKAMAASDMPTAITMLTRESQEMMLTGMVLQAAFMCMEDENKGKELEQLFKKHGLDDPNLAAEDSSDDGPVDLEALADKLPAFVGDLTAWIKANEDESDGGFPKLGAMSDLKIDGDKATGLVSTEHGDQPMDFMKIDGSWKVHLAMDPPAAPSVDEMGLDFSDTGDGLLGLMQIGEKSSGLNHAFAYRAKFFDDPCVMLVLTAIEVSEEKRSELAAQLKEDDANTFFFPDGPQVSLALTPEGELLSMHVWIDNSSMNSNRGPGVDVTIEGDRISGRVGMLPESFADEELQFQAQFDTEISF